MNKANKNAAMVFSLWSYLNGDRRYLVANAQRNRTMKRIITRMTRRVNKAICYIEAQ
jgi:hypothetical protein